MWRLIALALACVACAGCASLAQQPASTVPSAAPEREVLVMLRESPVRHFQPGVTYSDGYPSASAPARQRREASDLAREYGLRLVSDWPMPALGIRCFLAQVEGGQAPAQVADRLAADPRVESAQPVHTFRTFGHDDPYYRLQTSAAVLRLDELHRLATGRQVLIAEIDTGVDLGHPDLDGQLIDARNFVDGTAYVAELHGTAVAGIVVAKADNGIGIVGVAPDARLMPLRACWQDGQGSASARCTSFTLAKAIQYAVEQHARILNLSLAGPHDRLLERLIDKAIEQGATVVAAVDPAAPAASFPANHTGVIATTSASSNAVHGERVVRAPGERILTTVPGSSWAFVSGSSFATAHVTGIAALVLQLSPALTGRDVASLFQAHVTPGAASVPPPGIDACAMLARLSPHQPCDCCRPAANGPALGRPAPDSS